MGGVPLLVRSLDMSNTIPDLKVTSMFLTYFAARLIELSTEIRAAEKIQAWWKKVTQIKRQKEMEKKFKE